MKILKKKYIILILTLIIAPLIVNYCSKDFERENRPSYILKNAITNLDSIITIQASNSHAKQSEPLLIYFDDIIQKKIAIHSSIMAYTWTIDLRKIDKRLTFDGKHKIKAGFKPESLSDEMSIIIDTKTPSIKALIIGDSLQKKLAVKGISSNNFYLDTLKAEVYFFHKGQSQKIDVPVTKIVQQSSGNLTFEFKTVLQGFPKFSNNDPEFTKPFFGFKITDIAGNTYFSKQSYAEFIAPGDKVFGVSNIGEVTYDHSIDNFNLLTSNFIIKTNKKAFRKLPSGEPAIILRVNNKIGTTQRELIWQSKLNNKQPLTLIYRDEKQIGTTFDNKYIDDVPDELIVDYRVEQVDSNNKLYTSNVSNSLSKKRFEQDSLNQELINLQNKISQQLKAKDSLNNIFRDFNNPIRNEPAFSKNKKGYLQKDLSSYVDLHLPDTLYTNQENIISLNFYDENIDTKGTPIQISLLSNNTIILQQSFELKQYNKIRIVPQTASGGQYKLSLGIYFKDQLDGEYPPFYKITRNVIVK